MPREPSPYKTLHVIWGCKNNCGIGHSIPKRLHPWVSKSSSVWDVQHLPRAAEAHNISLCRCRNGSRLARPHLLWISPAGPRSARKPNMCSASQRAEIKQAAATPDQCLTAGFGHTWFCQAALNRCTRGQGLSAGHTTAWPLLPSSWD